MSIRHEDTMRDVMARAVAQTGETLLEMSEASAVLLVFLRHMGCTFCKEAVCEIGKLRGEIEMGLSSGLESSLESSVELGARVVFVYMPGGGDAATQRTRAERFFGKYGVGDVARIADGEQALYRSFGLDRASVGQVFGVKSFARGFVAGVLKGHGVGRLVGDGYQMPGVFLLRGGVVERSFRHASAGDVPDYVSLSRRA